MELSHQYGGFLTVSFCGNIWSHPLNPLGELKRTPALLNACKQYPEAILFLYKYTTSSCFYNNESVTFGPFISGLTRNYGVRYDNCGWNGALDALLGEGHGKKYPAAAGIGTVMEQTCVNGGAVWDGPELTWREECFHEVNRSTVDGYTRRNWERFPNMNGVWIDMFRKVIDGTLYIPTRQEVVEKTKIVVVNDLSSGSDEQRYATWGSLYDGLYKQDDPMNRGNGQWMDNFCYFKKTGRYGAIPMVTGLYDDLARAIPVQVKKSVQATRWNTTAKKTTEFNGQYPEVSVGDLYVNRYRNQLVTYTPYSYLNKKTTAEATIPLQYNSCEELQLKYDKLSSGLIREYADHIDFYLNNYRNDTTIQRSDVITVKGAALEPSFTFARHATAQGSASAQWDAESLTYTLTVKHCGAVDVSISCTGTADRSTAAPDAIALQPLPEPQRPALSRSEILIEAEDMDFKSIASCVTDPYGWGYRSVRGHAGNGFMDMGTNSAGALRHQLKLVAGQEGDYLIGVRYTSPTRSGNLIATANGKRSSVKCEKTATNEWRWATFEATMREGQNNLVLSNSSGLPLYIDQVSYRPADVEPMKYAVTINEAENGTVSADKTEAAEGELITLTIEPREGHLLKQLRVVNSVFYTLSKTIDIDEANSTVSFTMPGDNVTLQPLFADATSVYKLDFSSINAGTLPPGWRCVQENSEVHEYPNTFAQGARAFNGFSGHQGKALYWRNDCAEYGRQQAFPLTLQPGSYKLTFAMAAWKESPKYKVQLLDALTGSAIASSATFTATPNANGSQSASVVSAQNRELSFDIAKAGNYIVRFHDETTGGGYHEFLLLECSINSDLTGIRLVDADGTAARTIFDASGRQRQQPGRGINIIRTPDGKSRKTVKR